jgi:hypothetical protein
MTAHSHAIVWIDHRQAKVIFFNADVGDTSTIHAAEPASHIHSKAGSATGTHLHGEPIYFDEIVRTLAPALIFVVVGPSAAKEEFIAHLRAKHPELAKRLAGVEPLDKESDGQLLAFARQYFQRKDRMTPQRLDA